MTQNQVIDQIRQFVKQKLDNEGTGHDWWHIERVYNLAIALAKREGADLFTVKVAALLHDIADHKFNNGNSAIGAKIAKQLLIECGCKAELAETVYTIINTMSYKGGTVSSKQETLEGKVVQDADRLDALGAIGIARTFAYGGSKGRELYNPEIKPQQYENFESYKKSNSPTLNHFYEKLLLLKDLMNTESATELAKKRTEYMKQYLQQFYSEWDALDFDA
ncbi:HD domain-containing protein [Haloplasma contractile]|uniref:Hydrolase protein n=1 Tax=Haloplasma contractile SSD-17B TaxID=1033810 RepID=U2FRF5_9MOLU|nr:HD domain-containing protein [Haloplasma contractile]ERJ13539.1 putative hydrolase protein [Haloplasma contractile SSD-17B]